jgi:hypothetical protein
MDLSEWLSTATDDASARAIAATINRSHTAVSGWIRRGEMPCEVVMQIARAYGADPLHGLIASKHLEVSDLTASSMREVIKYLPSEMLVQELADRVEVFNAAKREGKQWNPSRVPGPFGQIWLN